MCSIRHLTFRFLMHLRVGGKKKNKCHVVWMKLAHSITAMIHHIRLRRLLSLKNVIIFGILTLVFIFFILAFSNELYKHDSKSVIYKHNLISQLRKSNLNDVVHFKNSGSNGDEKILYHKDTRPPLTVPRIAKYCNPPNSQPMGDEGVVSDDYKLINVHVVIRHGDRSPISRLPGFQREDMSCLLDVSQFSHIPKVANYPHVIATASEERSKDNSFKRWSVYPSHTICADGQLTGRGAIQQILNGIHYSERYFHQHQLFDATNWPKKVVAYSTEVSRTYQSAVAFLYGLLPSFEIGKINLKHASNINFCEEKIVHGACTCPGVDTARNRAGRECRMEPGYAVIMKRYSHLVDHISEVVNLKAKDLQYPSPIMDSLTGYACHNMPPPCNANNTCITAKTLEAIWEPIDYQSSCLNRNENYKKFSKIAMHGLIYRIVLELNIAIENGTNPAFHLYSGHDTTVSPLISALELEDGVWPGYASRIVFELYKKQSTGEHVIRILQNGRVVTKESIFCRGKTKDGFCNFENLKDFASRDNFVSLCESL
ncbi:2-phosphoxylose phosphatase 1-like isoform X2 [Physella acuta]|uniref:2-phosphoxylose phosphatase 1-like isoform X2 n=1 Tax=Physella acuta TaxID=109671 RepID=UPI0027DDD368|nr:2-phosphoxylose phosphatase 1-like isoform X2 [Physella acuta]